MTGRYSRQEPYIGSNKLKEIKVAVVGVGAVGTYVAELLTRCGVGELFLFDDDKVEIHNLTGQLYNESDIGKPKVMCLMNRLTRINSEVRIFANNMMITKEEQLPKDLNYLFSCVDLFRARLTLLNYQKRKNPKCIVLDGGTSDETTTIGTIQMYNRTQGHITELKHFYPNLEKKLQTEEVMPCTEEVIPSLITTSAMVATIEVQMMLQHLKEGKLYEEMCQISLGKKPSINWFKKNDTQNRRNG